MKSHQPPTDGPAREPELRVEQLAENCWIWCWADPRLGVELRSNTTYGSRDAAASSARLAYPDVPLAEETA